MLGLASTLSWGDSITKMVRCGERTVEMGAYKWIMVVLMRREILCRFPLELGFIAVLLPVLESSCSPNLAEAEVGLGERKRHHSLDPAQS